MLVMSSGREVAIATRTVPMKKPPSPVRIEMTSADCTIRMAARANAPALAAKMSQITLAAPMHSG